MLNHTSSLRFSLLRQLADTPRQDAVAGKIHEIDKITFRRKYFLKIYFRAFHGKKNCI